MSRLRKYSSKEAVAERAIASTAVENFMGGTSYTLTPLDTLRIVAASSIFGEPQYYRNGLESPKTAPFLEADIFAESFGEKSAVDIFTSSIDAALSADFRGTLKLAKELREDYNMRLNPSVIYVRAAMHPDRAKFNQENPGYMKAIGKAIAGRPDDLTNQFDYYMYLNGSKASLPSLLKRTWAERLEEYSRYQLNKYKGKSLIDLVRISHASNADINELMKTGKLEVYSSEQTWETLRSAGKSWTEILNTIKMPHMALLRNLRGIFTEVEDLQLAHRVIEQLKGGVLGGKQFPFRYYSAFRSIAKAELNHQRVLMDGLEECMDIAVSNMPKLAGKVACLSDNSGSAWGTFNSEYGTVTVAEIANLSSLITAKQADEGYVGVFGDRLSIEPVSKRNGLLGQLNETSKRGTTQGRSTENGIWLFWKEALEKNIHYDTVFIYSDMQAGHGGLFGYSKEYSKFKYNNTHHIDVLKLVSEYRKRVNPKLNIFTVQVAGYDNSVLPQNLYRGAVLAGWTGREPVFAKAIIDAWDSIEKK